MRNSLRILTAGRYRSAVSFHCMIAFCWMIGLVQPASTCQQTEITFHFVDENGKSVTVSKAELLLVAWGYTERVVLPLDDSGHTLHLCMDESWLHAKWEGFKYMDGVYLSLVAPGFASIRSERFEWIGVMDSSGVRLDETRIDFPNTQSIAVQERQHEEFHLKFRKPQKRYLRVIDDDGKSVPGIKITSYMFWSNSNHCGFLSGADLLRVDETDTNGRISVADHDFEYAFVFDLEKYSLKNTGSPYLPPHLMTHLHQTETTVYVHRWKSRTLQIYVRRAGVPFSGASLIATIAGCPCGACSGLLAVSDSNGMIALTDFYPDKWELIFFQQDGKIIWQQKMEDLPATGTLEVRLP